MNANTEYYTPIQYALVATKYILEAVNSVPAGNDYIILDRCSGTGVLEQALVGLMDKNGQSLISHCVMSTLDPKHGDLMRRKFGGIIRVWLPSTDCLTQEYIENDVINAYINNPKCTIIMFENIPSRDAAASDKDTIPESFLNSYVAQQYQNYLSLDLRRSNTSNSRELSNLFVWSAFEYYLKKPNDAYIVFSPIKYWKTAGLANRQFKGGFVCNRKLFGCTASGITCIFWGNMNASFKQIELPVLDVLDGKLTEITSVSVKQCLTQFTAFYDKRQFDDDLTTAVYCETDGSEALDRNCDGKSVWNKNIIAYLRTTGFTVGPMSCYLTRSTLYATRGTYLRRDKYLMLLPLFVAKQLPVMRYWWMRDVLYTSADKGTEYQTDREFLKRCLIYTTLTNQNKCISFYGTDGRLYRNELCLDDNTIASQDLQTLLDETGVLQIEKNLLGIWKDIRDFVHQADGYDNCFAYGTYQIGREWDTYTYRSVPSKRYRIYDNRALHALLIRLRDVLSQYFMDYIFDDLLKYELIK